MKFGNRSLTASRPSNHSWTAVISWLAMIALIAIAIGGFNEWFHAGLPHSIHVLHLLFVLSTVLLLAVIAFAIEHFARHLLNSRVKETHNRLHLAMAFGKSVGWDSNYSTGRIQWFGDLQGMFGIPSETFTATANDFYRYVHTDDRERVSQAVTRSRENNEPYSTEFRIVHEDGTVHWVGANGKFYYRANGEPERMLGIAVDITDRKRIDERLRLAVQAGRMFVYEWDPLSDMVTRSPEAVEVLGKGEPLQLTRAELLARVQSDAGEFEASYSKLTPGNPASQTTYRFKRIDGKSVWLEKSTRGIFDSAGNLVKVVGVAADIDDRIKAEQALRDREASFRRVVDHIGDALAVDDLDGHIIFANDRFRNLFGFGPEELPNVKFEDYVASEYLAKAHDLRNRRKRGEFVPAHFEYEGIRRDGSRLWVDADIVPITNEKGELMGTQKLLRDVTERKRAELVLRESEERFRLVANSAPVMIWLSDPDKLCNYFNKQWLEFTGRPLEAELGNGWAEGVHPEDRSECLTIYAEAFERRERFEMQYRLRRHDGKYRWIFDIGVPRFNRDGSFAGYIGSCMDVTDQKVAEEALANMGRKLIEAHEEERTWIGRELHDDINQRLALVAVELDRWMQHVAPSGPEALDYIQKAKARIMDISNDVQALSHRLHSSKLEYLGLSAAARSFCREFAEQHNVKIQFNQSGLPFTVPKEVSLSLFRVLQEALQNALKHSRVKEFTVDLHGTSEKIELRVSDSGTGFDQHEAIAHGGLGLISMRERLQLVDGVLSIQTKPGAGTTIYASVPLTNQEYQAIAG